MQSIASRQASRTKDYVLSAYSTFLLFNKTEQRDVAVCLNMFKTTNSAKRTQGIWGRAPRKVNVYPPTTPRGGVFWDIIGPTGGVR
jgi:hypothetical protein